MSENDRRRRELEDEGWTGATKPELDQLNRAKTDGMTDQQLFDRVHSGLPSDQAKAALRRRGHDI